MTEEEYKLKLQEIDNEAYQKKRELRIWYLHNCAKYEIGDIIEDHYHIIKIEGKKVANSAFKLLPEIVYHGIQLKKDLTPRKKQDNTVMYESNVERKLN